MKEMVGGCCVCSDERGWAENPLVYCDGQGCTVAVHQACYGIVTVPTGPWFCRKCESQERAARVSHVQRCELCPSRDGALKKTDNSAWAHVVCALYIPEVRFGNVTTMEPIILQLIPTERFSKVCYICEEQGKGSRATVGACMQCNKSGCKQQFHVTCAQALGLLCEEAGNYLDNVKYCGYCQHHYSKLKKGGNVKTIPPYKPIPADNGSSDSSPEKESDIVVRQQGIGSKRKSGGKAAATVVGAKSSAVGKVGGHSPAAGELSSISPDITGETSKGSSPSSNRDLATTVPNSIAGNSKFTTSNFVESVVTPQGESVFGADVLQQNPRVNVPPSGSLGKKRRTGGSRTPTIGLTSENSSDAHPNVSALIVNPSHISSSSNISDSSIINSDVKKSTNLSGSLTNVTNPLTSSSESVVVSNIMNRSLPVPSSNVITPTPSTHSMTTGIVVSVPLTAASLQPSVQVPQAATTVFHQTSVVPAGDSRFSLVPQEEQPVPPPPPAPGKRSRSQSTEKVEKGRNKKRGSAGVNNIVTTITTTTTSSSSCAATSTCTTSAAALPGKRGGRGTGNTPPPPLLGTMVKDSPPSSPGSETHSGGRRSRNKRSNGRERDEKDVKLFQNGVSAPHMLGNQLNPSSTMAQKMSDTLSAELEAHSIFTDASTTSTLVGPPLHSRVIASVRSGSNATSTTSSSAAPPGSIPQSLDQLLERQWEQGSQFLMEQAQHFDIASLLSCLHQLRAENLRLEEHVNSLLQRRDHLLAVNARLAIPLTSQPPAQVNNVHPGTGHQHQDPSRNPRVNNSYLPHAMENGLPPDPSPPTGTMGYPHQHRSPLGAAGTQPSPTIRQSPAGSGYMLSQSPLNPTPPGSTNTTPGVVRSTSATPDPMRSTDGRRSGYPVYQVSAPAVSQVPVVTTQQMVIRRDAVSDLHHQMPSTKPG